MSEIARIVEQLQQVHEGGAWHGPSVRDALEGVGAAAAVKRPLLAAHCIWEIVHHMRVTNDNVRSHFTGQGAPQDPDWPVLKDIGDTAWKAEITRLEASQRALRDAVARVPEARLHENVPGQSHSHWYELLGILHHDTYHAGQISLLKKER